MRQEIIRVKNGDLASLITNIFFNVDSDDKDLSFTEDLIDWLSDDENIEDEQVLRKITFGEEDE